MENLNNKIIELASNLAHNRTFYDSGDICSNEDDMYKQKGDKNYQEDCDTYTDEIQDRFNVNYDCYLGEISKIFDESILEEKSNNKSRKEMIDFIIKYAGDEYESKNDFISLAKKTDKDLLYNVNNIIQYYKINHNKKLNF